VAILVWPAYELSNSFKYTYSLFFSDKPISLLILL
jgi:hypothetical protein